MLPLNEYRDAAQEAARRAATVLEDWRSKFQVREKQDVQFRIDAFNLMNSFIPGPTNTGSPTSASVPSFANVSNNLFGQILSAQPTRKLQFALRYTF